MPSLTVSEASIRAASLAVKSYDIALNLAQGDTEFGSHTVIEFDSRDRQDTWVDVKPAALESVHLNGRALDVSGLYDGRLHLTGLEEHNTLDVVARMAYSHDGEGLHRAVDPEDKQAYVYAMTFLPAAPRVFACFDQPDLKAIYRVSVTAPTDWTVLGNGHATQIEPGVWTLAETLPLATYFATLVAGPYHSVTAEHDGILLGLHCRQSLAPHLDKDADELFTVTGQCFDEFHRLFGIRYPFGDYHQVFCPEFNAGAMENPGCVTFTDTLVFKAQATDMLRTVRAVIIAHEMAHQWFGDLVTMTWWDDLWLNESFADYMGYRVAHDVTQFTQAWSEFSFRRKAWGMAADQRTSTHPIAGNGARDAEEAMTAFDGISYCKGASALRQLNAYLGDEAFMAGVIDHLQSHSYGNARLSDLLDSWDRASDKDVRGWADAWLRTSGVDTLTTGVSAQGQPVIRRINGSPEAVSRPHAVTVTWFGASGQVESVPLLLTGGETPVLLPGYDGTGLILPDSRDETWAKLVLDKDSLEQAGDTLLAVDDQLARTVIWSALRESLLDAALDPDRYVAVVEKALPRESDMGVDTILYAAASMYVGSLIADLSTRDRLSAVAQRILDVAEPGSNRQLIAARALVSTSTDTDLLLSWLSGGEPGGVLADEDFRWRVTRALCESGAFGLSDIDAEVDRDPSSQGALHALECRSSLPDAEIKAAVWNSIVRDESLTNFQLYALADYFFRPGQRDLTDPYVERYFTEIPATAELRSGWVVETMAAKAFPRYAVSAQTIELADAALGMELLAAGVRREFSDGADDLRRALRIRETYGR